MKIPKSWNFVIITYYFDIKISIEISANLYDSNVQSANLWEAIHQTQWILWYKWRYLNPEKNSFEYCHKLLHEMLVTNEDFKIVRIPLYWKGVEKSTKNCVKILRLTFSRLSCLWWKKHDFLEFRLVSKRLQNHKY